MKKLYGLIVVAVFLVGCGGEDVVENTVVEDADVEVVVEDIPEVVMTEVEVEEAIVKCSKEKVFFQAKCLTKLAVQQKDPTICENIELVRSDEGFSSSDGYAVHVSTCYSRVGAAMDYDYSVCDVFEEGSENYKDCRGYIVQLEGYATHDVEVCEKAKEYGKSYEDCLASAVEEKEDLVFCERLDDNENVKRCKGFALQNLAVLHEDIGFCNEMVDGVLDTGSYGETHYPYCVTRVADRARDLSMCHVFENEHSTCVCYGQYFDEVNEEVCASKDLSADQAAQCGRCLELDLFKDAEIL